MRKDITTIVEETRRLFGLTRDEYALCAYVHFRIADPRNTNPGWCSDTKGEIADFVGITRQGLYKMIDRLVSIDLLEVDPPTGHLRVTVQWIESKTGSKLSLQAGVNLVDTECKQSLQAGVNLVAPIIKVKEDIKEEKGEGSAPAPDFQNPLEQKKDPPPFPADPPPPPGYNDRPKAETPTELQAALSAFYEAHPGEWELHMEKFGRASMQLWGRRSNDFEKQQAFEGYCAFAIENGRANHTYQAQNARLRRWFADQPTMQKPAQPQPAKEQASGPNYRRLN